MDLREDIKMNVRGKSSKSKSVSFLTDAEVALLTCSGEYLNRGSTNVSIVLVLLLPSLPFLLPRLVIR